MDSILGLVGLDRQAEAPGYAADYSYNSNNVKEEEGGLANQILAFIGIKGSWNYITLRILYQSQDLCASMLNAGIFAAVCLVP